MAGPFQIKLAWVTQSIPDSFGLVLSCADGTTLAKASANDEVSKTIEQGSAFNLTIVNQVKQVVASNKGLGELQLDFILIETNKITFMMMVSSQGKFFSITALDREKANLGIARALIYKSKTEYGDILDNFFYKKSNYHNSVESFAITFRKSERCNPTRTL